VVDPAAAQSHRHEAELAVKAHGVLLLVVLRRVELRSVGYQPTALAVELQDREWCILGELNSGLLHVTQAFVPLN
jgi:hypothetical protein